MGREHREPALVAGAAQREVVGAIRGGDAIVAFADDALGLVVAHALVARSVHANDAQRAMLSVSENPWLIDSRLPLMSQRSLKPVMYRASTAAASEPMEKRAPSPPSTPMSGDWRSSLRSASPSPSISERALKPKPAVGPPTTYGRTLAKLGSDTRATSGTSRYLSRRCAVVLPMGLPIGSVAVPSN